jgi:putative ABC transport system permease protein
MRVANIAIWNLGRRPMRSLLTVLGIAVAVGSFVAMIGLSRGIEQSWMNNLRARGTHLLAMQKGAVEILTSSINDDLEKEIGRIDGVQAVAGELGDLTTIEREHTAVAVGWPLGCYLWETLLLDKGRLPLKGETKTVLLGQSAAEALHKKPGDSLLVRDRTFQIVGVFRLGGVMGNNSVILPLQTMQEMMHRQSKVTGFFIRVDHPEIPSRIAEVRGKLQTAFPNLSILEADAAADHDLVLRLFRAVAWSISVIALVIALMMVLNTLLMSVMERTHEIGILSALGWPMGRIMGLIVIEGLILSMIGGTIGLGLGIGGLNLLTTFPHVRGLIEVEVTGRLLLEVLTAAVVLGGLGSLYPTWRAARLNTVDALRYE